MKRKFLLAVLVFLIIAAGTITFGDNYNFPEEQKGTLNVQMYDVSYLPSMSATHNWQDRKFIFARPYGTPVVKSALEKTNADPSQYDYIFYQPYSKSMGAGSKTAQKIWGYFIPNETGFYKFKTISDDGNYFKIYLHDFYSDLKSDYDFWNIYVDISHGNSSWNNWRSIFSSKNWSNLEDVYGYKNNKIESWRRKDHWKYWERFYWNGLILSNRMKVSENNVDVSSSHYLFEGYPYPIYLEYFNWGGQGKLQIQSSFNGSKFKTFDYTQFYSGISGVTSSLDTLKGEKEGNIFRLTWDKVDGATSYKVLYSETGDDDDYDLISNVTTNYYETQIPEGSNYNDKYFKIIAVVGDEEYQSNPVYLSGSITFNSLTGKFSDNSYDLSWNDVPSAEKYQVLYGDTESTADDILGGGENISPENTDFEISNPFNYIDKYMRVRALVNGVYYYSNPVVVQDTGSGIDITEENGKIKYHAYDNFNDGVLDLNVWENIVSYSLSESGGTLNGKGIAEIKLKNNYDNFESYRISIDMLRTASKFADGGLGGTDVSGDRWVSRINDYDRTVKVEFYNMENGDKAYFTGNHERPKKKDFYDYRYVLSAGVNGANPKLEIYNITGGMNPVLIDTWNISSSDVKFNFNKIFIGNGYGNNNLYKMDNFDFVGYKQKSFDSLVGENISGDYVLTWDPVAGATSYKILYGTSPNLQGTLVYDLPADTTEHTITAAQVAALSLVDKSIKVVAVVGGDEISSNEVIISDADAFSSLVGTFVGNNVGLSWNAFEGATSYTLLYGEENSIDKVIDGASNLPNTTLTYAINNVTEQSPYYNKFVQLKTFKDGIYYYSNKVILSKFDSLSGQQIDGTYYLNWDPIIGAIGYKIMFGDEEGNLNSLLVDNLGIDVSSYEITPEMIENIGLEGKLFKVVAVFEDTELDSNSMGFDKNFEIGSLTGSFNGDDYFLQWTGFDGADSFVVIYGEKDNLSNVVQGAENLGGNVRMYTIPSVDSESEYYGKYIKVVAIKDGISYYTNAVKAGLFDSLKFESFDDIYRLYWDEVIDATGYKIYYGDDPENIDTLLADLGPVTLEYLINNRDGGAADLFDKYFKVVAVLEDSEMNSNVLKLIETPNFATLEGSYSDHDFVLNWTAVDGIDSLSILYGEKDSVDQIVSDSINKDLETYTISNITEDSPYYGKYVRLKAVKNGVVFYSNTVLIEDIDFGGEPVSTEKGDFNGDLLSIEFGNEFEIGYRYLVTDGMYNPYFHFDLNGNQYLTYEEVITKVYKVVSGDKKLLSSKAVHNQDVDSYNSSVDIYPQVENNRFEAGSEYIVYISGKTVDRPEANLAQYLDEGIPAWRIPYEIASLTVNEQSVRVGLYIENYVYWDATDKIPVSLEIRDKNKRVFHADVDINEKIILPPSM